MIRAAILSVGLTLWAGCIRIPATKPATAPAKPRAETSGSQLLKQLPANANLVLEIDLKRLRENQQVGPLINSRARRIASLQEVSSKDIALYEKVDTVVFASYEIGTPHAETLILLQGSDIPVQPGATKLSDKVVALGGKNMLTRARAVARGDSDSLADSKTFMRTRDLAMPAQAKAAAARLAFRLDFEQRLHLAKRLGLDVMPATGSVWTDVIDDFALVAILTTDSKTQRDEVITSLKRELTDANAQLVYELLGISQLTPSVQLTRAKKVAKFIVLVGPRQLKRFVEQAFTEQ